MPTPQFPTLETPRLRLRELRHADVADVLAIHADARHMQHWGNTLFVDPAGAHYFIAQCRGGWKLQVPVMRWAIERLSDGAVLGTCGLFNWDQRWQRCTVGYELNASEARQGYMREALRAVLAYGFSRGLLHHVEALIHPDNAASLALAVGLGFRVQGRLRVYAYWDDTRHDQIQLGLLQPELVI